MSDTLSNIVKVGIALEGDFNKDEYEVFIESITGSLKLYSPGGADCINLIKECIEDSEDRIFNDLSDDEEMYIEVILKESFESEDVFINRYYEVLQVRRTEYR